MQIVKSKAKRGAIAILSSTTALLYSQQASAADCGTTKTFFDWGCNGTDDKTVITTVLIQFVNWMAAGVTIAVIGGVIYGAILYTSSGGNPEQSKKAMGIIRNAFIALIMYFAMWALLNWLVPGGLFN